METKKRSLFANSLYYGLILGVVLVVLSLIYYILNVNLFSLGMGILSMIISLALVIIAMLMGVKAYRDKSLDGKINFSQAFFSGLIIGLVAFIISTLYNYVFMTFIEPEYMQKGMNKLIETWGSQMTEEQLNTMIERMEKRMTTGKQLSNGIISGLIISVIISLIIGLVVKKEKYPDGENA